MSPLAIRRTACGEPAMKFSIRDLLLVTVIVALVMGWANEWFMHSVTHITTHDPSVL